MATGSGTKDDPWVLKTPPGTSEYQMWRDEAADPPALVCQVGWHAAQVPPARHRRPPRDAQGARRLDAARRRRRAEAGARGHGRGLGPVARQPGRRLVRPEEGPPRPVRHVHAAAARGARPGRAHPRREEQPDARRSDARCRRCGAWRAAARRRSVRGARRPEPPGDRRAARRAASARSRSSPTRCRSAGRPSRATCAS